MEIEPASTEMGKDQGNEDEETTASAAGEHPSNGWGGGGFALSCHGLDLVSERPQLPLVKFIVLAGMRRDCS